MNITSVHSYLTRCGKHLEEQPQIGGVTIQESSKVYTMLQETFHKADEECDIPICFNPSSEGSQYNECRNEIIELLTVDDASGAEVGRKLAHRLQVATTEKSGLGLLFLVTGESELNGERKLLISRFPADQGILARQDLDTLRVDLVDDIFMKSAVSYKAALYRGSSFDSDFWTGKAVDKQIKYGARDVARYWIRDFLSSDFETTSRAGTKRLAVALRDAASKSEDLSVKQEISAAAALAVNMEEEITNINGFCDDLRFSDTTKEAVKAQIQRDSLRQDTFRFDAEEFSKHLPYRSIELDNGATLTASADDFEAAFQRQEAPNESEEYVFRTQGKIIDDRLKKRK